MSMTAVKMSLTSVYGDADRFILMLGLIFDFNHSKSNSGTNHPCSLSENKSFRKLIFKSSVFINVCISDGKPKVNIFCWIVVLKEHSHFKRCNNYIPSIR